jgi:hypothetical protein
MAPSPPSGKGSRIDLRIHGEISPGQSIVIHADPEPLPGRRSHLRRSDPTKTATTQSGSPRQTAAKIVLRTIYTKKKVDRKQLDDLISFEGVRISDETLSRYIRRYKKEGLVTETSPGRYESVDPAIEKNLHLSRGI